MVGIGWVRVLVVVAAAAVIAATAALSSEPVPAAHGTQGAQQQNERGARDDHGAAVSAAARGETPPRGDCRNHGHWVSTVAKGLDSCDDNPRPPKGSADD